MTETTEEIKTKIHGTTNQIENAFKRGDILEAIQMLRGFEHCLLIANSRNAKLKTQVSSLTKKRDELEFKFEQRGRIMDGMTEDFKKLKSLLSKAEEENKERYVFKEDGFDNYEFVNFLDFPKQKAKYLRRFKRENKVFREVTYGSERMVYYTFDGNDCHFFWDEQEALSSLNKSKGE